MGLLDTHDAFVDARRNWSKYNLGVDFDTAWHNYYDKHYDPDNLQDWADPVWSEEAWNNMVRENGGDPDLYKDDYNDLDTFGESVMESFDIMTATDIVRALYDKYPEVEFVYEDGPKNGEVLLVFDLGDSPLDMEELTSWLEGCGADVSFAGPYMKLLVPEDEIDESLRTKLFKKIGCYSDGSPMEESLLESSNNFIDDSDLADIEDEAYFDLGLEVEVDNDNSYEYSDKAIKITLEDSSEPYDDLLDEIFQWFKRKIGKTILKGYTWTEAAYDSDSISIGIKTVADESLSESTASNAKKSLSKLISWLRKQGDESTRSLNRGQVADMKNEINQFSETIPSAYADVTDLSNQLIDKIEYGVSCNKVANVLVKLYAINESLSEEFDPNKDYKITFQTTQYGDLQSHMVSGKDVEEVLKKMKEHKYIVWPVKECDTNESLNEDAFNFEDAKAFIKKCAKIKPGKTLDLIQGWLYNNGYEDGSDDFKLSELADLLGETSKEWLALDKHDIIDVAKYLSQVIDKSKSNESLTEGEIKRYSDVVPKENRKYWYFTTHGIQPGSVPKDVNILEIRDGVSKNGMSGTFVCLDAILNTSELKEYDMKEERPVDESKDKKPYDLKGHIEHRGHKVPGKSNLILKNKSEDESLNEKRDDDDDDNNPENLMEIDLGSDKNARVVDGVLGQLSDGYWENSSGAEKYWNCADIIGNHKLKIKTKFYRKRVWRPGWVHSTYELAQSGFYGKDESKIKAYFASKIKQLVKIEQEDYPSKNLTWDRHNNTPLRYIPDCTVAEAYACYDFLKGRSGHSYDITDESLTEGAMTNGSYSLYNGWVKVPDKDSIPDQYPELEPEYSEWVEKANKCETIDDIDAFLDDVYKLRQQGLLSSGEYGKENLIFKELRNNGFLQELKDMKVKLQNKEMSLEGLQESVCNESASLSYEEAADFFAKKGLELRQDIFNLILSSNGIKNDMEGSGELNWNEGHKSEGKEQLNEAELDDSRAQELANYLDIDASEVEKGNYDNSYIVGDEEYYVLTYDEAEALAKEQVKEMADEMGLEAFSKDFQEDILYNYIDDSAIDEFIDEEADYFRTQENDEAEAERLEALSPTDRLEYIYDIYGPDGFEDWAKDYINWDLVAEEVVRLDGPENGLATYDGNEIQLDTYYAYRID